MMKRLRISAFEARAQQLVEGSFRRLLGGGLATPDVTSRLAQAVEDSWADGRFADAFTIALHPADAARILAGQPDIEQLLADYLAQLAQQAEGQSLPLQVTLLADESVPRQQVVVTAVPRPTDNPTTQFHVQRPAVDEALEELMTALRAVDAYLIVDGGRHVALDKPMIGLGRRMDNDVVLDLPTISRRHAQIRWRYGHFVLYDLSNRPGRTAVNGQPVQECALQPGDVIALSEVKMIYGEGWDEADGQRRPERAFDHQETMPRPRDLSGDG